MLLGVEGGGKYLPIASVTLCRQSYHNTSRISCWVLLERRRRAAGSCYVAIPVIFDIFFFPFQFVLILIRRMSQLARAISKKLWRKYVCLKHIYFFIWAIKPTCHMTFEFSFLECSLMPWLQCVHAHACTFFCSGS